MIMLRNRRDDQETLYNEALEELKQGEEPRLALELVGDPEFPLDRAELLCTQGEYTHEPEFIVPELVVAFLRRNDLNGEIVERVTEPLPKCSWLPLKQRMLIQQAVTAWIVRETFAAHTYDDAEL